jgi:hypothetical protein
VWLQNLSTVEMVFMSWVGHSLPTLAAMSLMDLFSCYESECECKSVVSDDDSPIQTFQAEPMLHISSSSQAVSMEPESDEEGSPTKKTRTSFNNYQSEKLSFSDISEGLRQMKETGYWCCSMMCHLWVTVNIVLFCPIGKFKRSS